MNKHPITKILSSLACLGLAASLVQSVSAQSWVNTDLNGLWADPNNWNPAGVPATNAGATTIINPAPLPICTITNGEVESPGLGSDHSSTYGSVFGPEFGASLNIAGTLNFDWVIAPVQNNPAPGARTVINVTGSGQLNGVNLAVGDQWFYHAAPYVTLNMYNNAQANVANLWTAGHINLFDNSMINATNGVIDQGLDFADTDGTKAINIAGGKLVTVAGATAQFLNFISRGFLLGYGVAPNSANVVTTSGGTGTTNIVDNNLSIVDNGTNTIVSNDPISGALTAIAFQPLLLPSSAPGTIQQSTLMGTYPGAASGVVLSSPDPGVHAGTTPTYTSSNPNVFTVDANGVVTSVSPGTGTLTAHVGSFSAGTPVTVQPFSTVSHVLTPTSGLIHRYSFSESSGTNASDSIGGATASLVGTAAFSGSGQLTLDGNVGYMQMPAGIIAGQDTVTIETWASFAPTLNNFCVLFAFGDTDTNLDANNGLGENYIAFQPHTGGATAQAAFGQGLPGFTAETDAFQPQALDSMSNVQVVAVYNPPAGVFSYYTNGVLAATASIYNDLAAPASFNGPFYNKHSILANVIGADNLGYVGHSLYAGDPPLAGSVDEFRIYNAALTPSQIKADYLLGPNGLPGANKVVSVSAIVSGSNIIVTWPTNSAYVNLVGSPGFGAAAQWTPVSNGTLTIVGSNFQETIPVAGAARYFGLE